MNKPLLLTTGALLFGALSFGTAQEASADVRVRLGGGISVRSYPRSTYRPAYRPYYRPVYRPVYRPYYRPSYSVGGSIWIGGSTYSGYGYGGSYRTYAAPPPAPNCACGPGAVPSYYPGYYTPQPAAQAEPAELPRFAIGGYAGGFELNEESGSDVGLLARLRLTEGLIVEGEIGASELEHQRDSSEDPSSRFGASLLYEIGARNTWAPYLLVGGGAIHTENRYGDTQTGFGEIGVGLRWALTNNLHLAFDIRAGAQERNEMYLDAPQGGVAERVILPTDDDEDTDSYTRGRLSAMLYF